MDFLNQPRDPNNFIRRMAGSGKAFRNTQQLNIPADAWVATVNGPKRIRDIVKSATGDFNIPVQALFDDEGKMIDSGGIKSAISSLKTGRHNADLNVGIVERFLKAYTTHQTINTKESLRVNMADFYTSMVERMAKDGERYHVQMFSGMRLTADPTIPLGDLHGKRPGELTDFSKVEQFGHARINEYGGLTIRVNPAISVPQIQDFDEDAFTGAIISKYDKHGRLVKSKIFAQKWPHTIVHGAITQVNTDEMEAARMGVPFYDNNTKIRKLISPRMEEMTANLDSMMAMRKPNREMVAEKIAAHLHDDLIGNFTVRMQAKEQEMSQALIDTLPDWAGPIIGSKQAHDLQKRVLANPDYAHAFLKPLTRSGQYKADAENLIKAVQRGRELTDSDLMSIFQSRIAYSGYDRFFSNPKDLIGMTPEKQMAYISAVQSGTDLDKARMALGTFGHTLVQGKTFNNTKRVVDVAKLEYNELGQVKRGGEFRTTVLDALMAPSVKDSSGKMYGLLSLQGINIPDEYAPTDGLGLHQPLALTRRDLSGRIKPLVGANIDNNAETVALLLPVIDAKTKQRVNLKSFLRDELERELSGEFFHGANGTTIGQLEGRFGVDNLTKAHSSGIVSKMARLAGVTPDDLYRAMERGDDNGMALLTRAKTLYDISEHPGSLKVVDDALRRIVGRWGVDAVGQRNGESRLEFSDRQYRKFGAMTGIDLGTHGLNPEEKLQRLMGVHDQVPFVPAVSAMDQTGRSYRTLLSHADNISAPIYADQQAFAVPKRSVKVSRSFHNNVGFEANIGIVDMDATGLEHLFGDEAKFEASGITTGLTWATPQGANKMAKAIIEGVQQGVSDTLDAEHPYPVSYVNEEGKKITRYFDKPIETLRKMITDLGNVRVVPDTVMGKITAHLPAGAENLDFIMGAHELMDKGGNIDFMRLSAQQHGGPAVDVFRRLSEDPSSVSKKELFDSLQMFETSFHDTNGSIIDQVSIPVIKRDIEVSMLSSSAKRGDIVGTTIENMKASFADAAHHAAYRDAGSNLLGSETAGRAVMDATEAMAQSFGWSQTEMYEAIHQSLGENIGRNPQTAGYDILKALGGAIGWEPSSQIDHGVKQLVTSQESKLVRVSELNGAHAAMFKEFLETLMSHYK